MEKEDFSEEVVRKAKEYIERPEYKFISSVCRKEVIQHVEILSGMVTVMMDHLKKDKKYDKELEKTLRLVVERCLQKGIKIGRNYTGTPEELLETISLIPIHPREIIKKIPKEKKKLSKYILHSFLLGKYAYETGLAISALLSKDQQEKYLKNLEKQTSTYIG